MRPVNGRRTLLSSRVYLSAYVQTCVFMPISETPLRPLQSDGYYWALMCVCFCFVFVFF